MQLMFGNDVACSTERIHNFNGPSKENNVIPNKDKQVVLAGGVNHFSLLYSMRWS